MLSDVFPFSYRCSLKTAKNGAPEVDPAQEERVVIYVLIPRLVCKNIYAYGRTQYEESVMAVSSFAFQGYAIQLKTKVRIVDLREHTAWIMPAELN